MLKNIFVLLRLKEKCHQQLQELSAALDWLGIGRVIVGESGVGL